MQQTLTGCAFCDASPSTETAEAHTWGQDERVTHPICVDCAIQTEPDPDERDHVACDGCGLVVDTLAALTRFRVELGASKARCSCAPAVVRADSRRTGRATSRSILSKRSANKEESDVRTSPPGTRAEPVI